VYYFYSDIKGRAVKILIIDDSITQRKVIARTLALLGHKKVYEAKHGLEGWQMLEKLKEVDLIIVDWEMPIMTGIDFIKKVRNSTQFSKIKIIMATSKHTKEDIINALSVGADNFIAKPFSDKTLAHHLKPILNSLTPNEAINHFIEEFSNTVQTDFTIDHGILKLSTNDKIISINIAQVIYHGALKVDMQNSTETTQDELTSDTPIYNLDKYTQL
jgi:two-component system chemotaxis response regulator CheY